MFTKRHLAIYTAILADPFIVTSYNPLVPVLKAVFNVDVTLVALGLTFHMIFLAVLCLFSGTLSDIYGRPKIMISGLFLSAVGLLVTALSPNIFVFLLGRSIQGAGDGFFMAVGLALIGDITPREEMGKAMGLYGVAVGLGATSGPLISGFISSINWRLMPSILFVYILAVAILVRVIFGSKQQSQGRKGSISILQEFSHVLRNRNVVVASVIAFISFFVYSGIQPLISDRLSLQPFLASTSSIGVLFSVVGFIAIFFSFIAGFLLDRFSDRKILGLSCAILMSVTFLLIFGTTYLQYLVLLPFLYGFNRIEQISLQTLAIRAMPESRGAVSSIYSFFSYTGFAAAPVIMGPIYMSQGISLVYSANIVLLLVSIALTFSIRGVSNLSKAPKPQS